MTARKNPPKPATTAPPEDPPVEADDETPPEPAPRDEKPTTIAMRQPSTGRTWQATSHAEALELGGHGWRWIDPEQDTSAVPQGFTGPGGGQ